MLGELLLLRLIHVLGGIFWIGSGIFTTFFLLPAMASTGPAAGQIVANLTKRRLYTILPIVAVLTMLSGLRLMMITSGGFSSSYFASRSGMTFSVAAVAAVLGFALSLVIARPAAVRMGALSQQAAADPANGPRLQAEIAALQRKLKSSSMVAMSLLIFAAAGMAVARYL